MLLRQSWGEFKIKSLLLFLIARGFKYIQIICVIAFALLEGSCMNI